MEIVLKYILPILSGLAAIIIIKDQARSWFRPQYWTGQKDHHEIAKVINELSMRGIDHSFCLDVELPRKQIEGWKLVTKVMKFRRFKFYVPGRGYLIKNTSR